MKIEEHLIMGTRRKRGIALVIANVIIALMSVRNEGAFSDYMLIGNAKCEGVFKKDGI